MPLRLPTPPSSAAPVVKPRKPRGLWKGRGTSNSLGPPLNNDDNPRPSKRQRYQPSTDTDGEESFFVQEDDNDAYYFVEYSESQDAESDLEMNSPQTVETESAHAQDWADLKELFSRAADQYESEHDINETLSLIRGVIHECHRLLLLYPDPSALYTRPARSRSASPGLISVSPSTRPRIKCQFKESPTAFHAILGTSLFLFGHILAQDPSLVLPDEPSDPSIYWLAALDVFETGESLPCRTNGGSDAPEDWRMALVWGRTLLCITDEALALAQRRQKTGLPAVAPPEPKWPSAAASPFAAIAMRRPPASRRVHPATSDPHELLLLAMDQFTRGIFHMPHPAHSSDEIPTDQSARPFSRANELFTIACEVLALAERLPEASERTRWATWADSLLQQMDMEGDTARDEWRGPVTRARGRCWLVVGTARVEDIEAMADAQGWDESSIFETEDVEEAREGLSRAVEFFERAVGSAKGEFGCEEDSSHLKEEEEQTRAFLAEALLTLANLTPEEDKREELYQRAQLLGGEVLDGMDLDD